MCEIHQQEPLLTPRIRKITRYIVNEQLFMPRTLSRFKRLPIIVGKGPLKRPCSFAIPSFILLQISTRKYLLTVTLNLWVWRTRCINFQKQFAMAWWNASLRYPLYLCMPTNSCNYLDISNICYQSTSVLISFLVFQ